ncbi:protein TonB [Bacteroidia bacterium]|nr:protein TonB [Bacteroidia bacterium]
MFVAFEWKTDTSNAKEIATITQAAAEEEAIPITQQEQAPPPPAPPAPKLTDLIDIVDDDQKIDDDIEIVDAESDAANQVVDFTQFGDYGAEDTGEEKIFVIVETQPGFKGDLNKYLSKNLKYPAVASENGTQGKVYIQFVVEKDGSITDVKVLRGVDESLDKEAVRVVQNMPKWSPGMQRNKPVRVSFTLPVNFKLE